MLQITESTREECGAYNLYVEAAVDASLTLVNAENRQQDWGIEAMWSGPRVY